MKPVTLRILLAASCVAAAVSAAHGQDLLLTGTEQGLWIIRAGAGEKGFDVAGRSTGLPWRQLAREHPGAMSAAVAVGDQLHVLLHGPTAHLMYRMEGGEPIVALNPRDPRWPDGVKPLAAFQAVGVREASSPSTRPSEPQGAQTASLIAVVARPPDKTTTLTTASTVPAPALAADQPPALAADTATTQPTGRAARGMVLSIFQYAQGNWSLLAERAGVPLGFGHRVLGAAVDGKLYLLITGNPAMGDRLMQWDGAAWSDPPLPPDSDSARIFGMLALGGQLVLMRAVPGSAPADWRLQLLVRDPQAGAYSVRLIRRQEEPLAWNPLSFTPDLPLAARLGDLIALVWRQDSQIKLGTCDLTGQFVALANVDVFQKQPPAKHGAEVRQYFVIAALGLTILLMLLMRRKVQPKPFALPAGQRAGELLKRLLAWLVDFVPIVVVVSPFFPMRTMGFSELVELARKGQTPDNVVYVTTISLAVHAVYCTLMEHRFGATLGKMLLKLRVVGDGGSRPKLAQLAMRNLVKIIELCWPPNLPLLLLIPLLNRNRQRLGDVFARTGVIDARTTPPAEPTGGPDGQSPDQNPPPGDR
ncbi:MAG TPA: RDD family protein [Phycisphaerae bacterium]|nr:RDD family protein [Phycisphaerae bacterium]